MATALTIASMALTAFSGMQQAAAAKEQGMQQQMIAHQQAEQTRLVAERNALIIRDQSKFQASQYKTKAGREQASAQREFLERRRQQRLSESRAVAVAGASGGGVGDPTVLNIIGDIAGEGDFAAQTALFEGDSAAHLLNTEAALAIYEGEQKAGMQEYQGASQAGLLEYQGDTARYNSKVAARNIKIGTAAKIAGQGASMMSKYSPSSSTGYNGTFAAPRAGSDTSPIIWTKGT
jgi:hypothetical protein